MLSRLRNRSSRNLPRRSASTAIVRFSRTVSRGEQLVDLIALGQAELADIGDVHAGDVAALEHDLARGRRHLAGQHLEEGGFAGAVRTDHAAQLAMIDGEIDVAVGDQAAITLGQAGRLQDRAGMVRRSPRAAGIDAAAAARTPASLRDRRRRPPCLGASSSGLLRLPVASAYRSLKPPMMPRAQEADQQHEHDAEHQLPGRAEPERRLQEILQEQPDRGAEQRTEQRAAAADRGLHHELARRIEGERIRRHEGLQHAEQSAGEAGIGGRDHEGGRACSHGCCGRPRCARSGLSRIALRIAPTGERTMRSAITMPTK